MTPPPRPVASAEPVRVVQFAAAKSGRPGVTTARRDEEQLEKRRSLVGAIGIVAGLVLLAVLAGYLF